MNVSRRDFIRTSSLAGAGIVSTPGVLASSPAVTSRRPICLFTKCLQFLDYGPMAEVVAKLGFDGADLTVRDGGQVLPENVEKDLPRVVKALQKESICAPMIATGINDVNDKNTERILGTASDLGIKYYRMGYFWYDLSKPVMQNLDGCKRILEKLEKLNRKYQVRGDYQNHSGPYQMVGGPVWDLYYLLKDINPEFIGVQYDIMHASVEGPYTWPYGFDLLAPWIGTLDMKDFKWEVDPAGQYKIKFVPLGEGMVNFNEYFKAIQKLKSKAPVSVHYEYDLGGAEHGTRNPDMPTEEIYKQLKKDLVFMKNTFTLMK